MEDPDATLSVSDTADVEEDDNDDSEADEVTSGPPTGASLFSGAPKVYVPFWNLLLSNLQLDLCALRACHVRVTTSSQPLLKRELLSYGKVVVMLHAGANGAIPPAVENGRGFSAQIQESSSH